MFIAQNPYPCFPVYFLHPLIWNLCISLIYFISEICCIEFTEVWVLIYSVSVLALSLGFCTSCSLLITISDSRVGRQHGFGERRQRFNIYWTLIKYPQLYKRSILFLNEGTIIFLILLMRKQVLIFFFLFLFLKLFVWLCLTVCEETQRQYLKNSKALM